LTRPGVSSRLGFHPVSFRVSNPRNDDPSCIEAVEPTELQVGDF
jgi:hypothetical protein